MRKKTAWIFAMLIIAALLVLVVNSRIKLNSEVIFGGADTVFVDSDKLSKPLDGYEDKTEQTDKYEDLNFPSISIDDWYLILINSENIKKDYTPSVVELGESGVYFDARVIDRLDNLVRAAKEAGFEPYLSAGYISYADQQQLLNDETVKISAKGKLSYDEAYKLAAESIAQPGTSDHQTALAVDITDKQYEHNDYSKMNKEFFAWLDEHCAEFGFIKRYPSSKKGITGWDEPWHYRFVGTEAATFIMENGMSYEEFVAHYNYQN